MNEHAVGKCSDFLSHGLIYFAFTVFFLFSAVSLTVAAEVNQPAFRIGDGANNAIVVCPDDKGSIAAFNRRYAAQDLAMYLKKITGTSIPVVDKVDEKQIAVGGLIFVGPSAFTQSLGLGSNRYDFGAGGYLIQTVGKNLALLGDDSDLGSRIGEREWGEAGTYSAVSAFLEKFGGVRWLWPGESGTVIPKSQEITVSALTHRSHPAYYKRYNSGLAEARVEKSGGGWAYFKGDHFREWSLFQRRQRMGMSIDVPLGHYGNAYLKATDYKKHPEYFSMIEGKRRPWNEGWKVVGQVCNSNPDVVKLFANKIIEETALGMSNGVWKGRSDVPCFSLTPNDGGFFCMCPECKKMDGEIEPWPPDATGGKIPNERYNEKVGWASSLSDRIWGFNNQIAREVAKSDPNIMMCCLAYSFYVNPPKSIKKIEDNIIVNICDMHVANGAPDEYQKGKDVFLEWSRKAKKLGIRGYYYSIGCRPHRIAEMLRLFYNIGCRYHTAESSQNYGFNWIEFVVNCKAQWDPFLDVDAVIDDYFKAAYGPGAPAMKKHLILQENVSMGYNTYSTFQNPKLIADHWSRPVREKLRGYLEEALRASGPQGEYADRIRFVGDAWEQLDSYCELYAALSVLKRQGLAVPYIEDEGTQASTPDEFRKSIEEANRHWQRLKGVMTRVEEKRGYAIHWYSTCVSPGSREGKCIDAWGKVVDYSYEQVCLNGGIALPAAWFFQADPAGKGHEEGWYKPEFQDKDWDRIRTDEVWEKQGYGVEKFPENAGDGYNGKAWYRIRTAVPADRQGLKAWLVLGAVDESFRAWVNGAKVGEFQYAAQGDKDAWHKPHRLDVTRAIKPGESNVIAVEVEDASGMGGIWKPCFVVFENEKKK